LTDKEANAVAASVQEALPIAEQMLSAVLKPSVDEKKLQDASRKANALTASFTTACDLLRKAGRQVEGELLADMQKQILDAAAATGEESDVWRVETDLTRFYVDYENLSSRLFSSGN
jgi:hypothetical protein